jgi:hypothetical protein
MCHARTRQPKRHFNKKPPHCEVRGQEPITGLTGESRPVVCLRLNQVDTNFVCSEYVGIGVVDSACKHGARDGRAVQFQC